VPTGQDGPSACRIAGAPSCGLDRETRYTPHGIGSMDIVSLLVLLLVAAVAGALGQAIAGYSPGGCLVSSAVGRIDALVGA
jgi:hypothetical protein